MKRLKVVLFLVVTALLIVALVNDMRPITAVLMWVVAWYLLMRMGEK